MNKNSKASILALALAGLMVVPTFANENDIASPKESLHKDIKTHNTSSFATPSNASPKEILQEENKTSSKSSFATPSNASQSESLTSLSISTPSNAVPVTQSLESRTEDGIEYISNGTEVTANITSEFNSAVLNLPETIEFNGKKLPITKLTGKVEGNNLEKVIIDNENLTKIDESVFQGVESLKEVRILHSFNLKEIEDRQFKNCKNLEKVELGYLCTMGVEVFSGCESLKDIDSILANTSNIGDRQFENCTSLTEMDLSKYGGRLGDNITRGCINLKTFKVGSITFDRLGSQDGSYLENFIICTNERPLYFWGGFSYSLTGDINLIFLDKNGNELTDTSVPTLGEQIVALEPFWHHPAESLFWDQWALPDYRSVIFHGTKANLRYYPWYEKRTIVKDRGPITLVDGPVKSGYRFTGWRVRYDSGYDGDICKEGDLYTDHISSEYITELHLYPEYEELGDNETYNVELDDELNNNVESYDLEKDSILNLSDMAPVDVEGYRFNGWRDIETNQIQTSHVKIDSDKKYKAVWKDASIQDYSVVLINDMVEGAEAEQELTVSEGDILDLNMYTPKEIDGWKFNGWVDLDTNEVVTGTVQINSNKRYKALWEKTRYRLCLIVDGQIVKDIELNKGTSLSDYLYTPVKEGYKFIGWKDEYDTYTSDMNIYSDIIAEAVFEQDLNQDLNQDLSPEPEPDQSDKEPDKEPENSGGNTETGGKDETPDEEPSNDDSKPSEKEDTVSVKDSSRNSSRDHKSVETGSWEFIKPYTWRYKDNGVVYKDGWRYLYNPYTETEEQPKDGWFHFAGDGLMDYGWFTDTDGQVYFLHNSSDGILGRMHTGWNWISDGQGHKHCYYFNEKGQLQKNTEIDGSKVNELGRWTVNGIEVERNEGIDIDQ